MLMPESMPTQYYQYCPDQFEETADCPSNWNPAEEESDYQQQ